MIGGGLSGQMNERRCLREQMNGSDNEQCRGLQQKKTWVSTESCDENSGVKKVINVPIALLF